MTTSFTSATSPSETPSGPDIGAWSAALRQTGCPMVRELSSNLAISHVAQWSALADGWRTGLDTECYACESGGSSYPLTSWA